MYTNETIASLILALAGVCNRQDTIQLSENGIRKVIYQNGVTKSICNTKVSTSTVSPDISAIPLPSLLWILINIERRTRLDCKYGEHWKLPEQMK